VAPKTKATTFDCPYLQNTWSNLHDFWQTSMLFCSEHNCWSRLIKFITQSGATWRKSATQILLSMTALEGFRVRHSRGKMYSGQWSRPSECLSLAAFPHYCTDLDVSWGNCKGCPVVVHYWADLQLVHGFHCYDNKAPNTKCQRVLVLALCLIVRCGAEPVWRDCWTKSTAAIIER